MKAVLFLCANNQTPYYWMLLIRCYCRPLSKTLLLWPNRDSHERFATSFVHSVRKIENSGTGLNVYSLE